MEPADRRAEKRLFDRVSFCDQLQVVVSLTLGQRMQGAERERIVKVGRGDVNTLFKEDWR